MSIFKASIFVVSVCHFSPIAFGSEGAGWLDSLTTEIGEDTRSVQDFPYQSDEKAFPSILRFQEAKSGKLNKLIVLEQITKLYSHSKELETAIKLFPSSFREQKIEKKRSLSLTRQQEASLKRINASFALEFTKLTQSFKSYDYCQSPLTMEGMVQNISAIADTSRVYLYSSLVVEKIDSEFPARVENVVRLLDAVHECKPTLVESLINLGLRVEILSLTNVLLEHKKIDKTTATNIVKWLGNKANAKKMLVESLRREFWVAYLFTKKASKALQSVTKEYKKKFPDDEPVFVEEKIMKQEIQCYDALITALEMEKTDGAVFDAFKVSQFPKELESELNSAKSWDKLHQANKQIPHVFNAYMLGVLMPGIAPPTFQSFISDANRLDAPLSK